MPAGGTGTRRLSGAAGMFKVAGGAPVSTAIACSICARVDPIPISDDWAA